MGIGLVRALEMAGLKLIYQLDQKYSRYKNRSLVDFHDLELLTVELLKNEDIRNIILTVLPPLWSMNSRI